MTKIKSSILFCATILAVIVLALTVSAFTYGSSTGLQFYSHGIPPDTFVLTSHGIPPDTFVLLAHGIPPDTIVLLAHGIPPDTIIAA